MKSLSEIVSSIRASLSAKWPSIVQVPDTVVDDVLVQAPATQYDLLYREMEYNALKVSFDGFLQILSSDTYLASLEGIFGLSSVNEVRAKVGADLDTYVAGFMMAPRFAAQKAKGALTIYFNSNALVTISAGVRFSTGGASPVYFEVLESATVNPTAYTTSLYVYTVGVQAMVEGPTGNVPALAINTTSGGVVGIVGVSNQYPTSGGLDIETSEHLMLRGALWLQGFSTNTNAGIKTTILGSGVRDAYIVTPGNINRVRTPGVDAWCISRSLGAAEDSFTWTAGSGSGYIPTKQPLIKAGSVSLFGYPDCTITVIQESANTPYGRSKYGRDMLTFSFPTTSPAVGETVTLNYQYNAALLAVEALFKDPNPELFVDIMAKEAVELPIYIKIVVKMLTGTTADVVSTSTAIKTAIKAQVNGLLMGGYYDQSDMVVAAATVSEVDSVVVNSFDFYPAIGIQNTLTAKFNEYLSVADAYIIISFEG